MPSFDLVLPLDIGCPVDCLEQSRRPKRAQHRMDGLLLQEPLCTCPELFGIALVLLQPLLENFVYRGSLPGRSMIRVHRLDRAELQYRLSIESEWVGLQAIDRRYGDLVRPLLRGRARLGLFNRACRAWIVEGSGKALETRVA